MHELSMAQSIVDIVEDLGEKQGFGKVLRIRIGVGVLSGVVRESLEFCFSAVTQGTRLQEAAVEYLTIPLQLTCRDCGQECEQFEVRLCCAHCGSNLVEVRGGRDLKVIDLEV